MIGRSAFPRASENVYCQLPTRMSDDLLTPEVSVFSFPTVVEHPDTRIQTSNTHKDRSNQPVFIQSTIGRSIVKDMLVAYRVTGYARFIMCWCFVCQSFRPDLDERTMTDENTFLISDTHFDHQNIIQYCSRDFKNNDDMNTFLLIP